MSLINQLRCWITALILKSLFPWRYALARRISPDTTSLIKYRPRRPPELRLPPRSHLIYHQANVDADAAQHSLRSLAEQIPQEDEILFLDIGATGQNAWLTPFFAHEWCSYSSCQARHPEQRSYTFGLNAAMHGLKAPTLFVWRTDYFFPAGLMNCYLQALRSADFAAPYNFLIGHPEVTSSYLTEHQDRLSPYDSAFWQSRSHTCSLYETQDPALFAIKRHLWNKIGGLNHELWGYGWQFAELAARVRAQTPASRISYFESPRPLHQTHGGSRMYSQEKNDTEVQAGIDRFKTFLGGDSAYQAYRLQHLLPPQMPD
jgi:hypothetical protein